MILLLLQHNIARRRPYIPLHHHHTRPHNASSSLYYFILYCIIIINIIHTGHDNNTLGAQTTARVIGVCRRGDVRYENWTFGRTHAHAGIIRRYIVYYYYYECYTPHGLWCVACFSSSASSSSSPSGGGGRWSRCRTEDLGASKVKVTSPVTGRSPPSLRILPDRPDGFATAAASNTRQDEIASWGSGFPPSVHRHVVADTEPRPSATATAADEPGSPLGKRSCCDRGEVEEDGRCGARVLGRSGVLVEETDRGFYLPEK